MWTVVSGVIALVAAVLGSRPVGRALKRRPVAWYVAANVAVFLVGLTLIVVASVVDPVAAGSSGLVRGLLEGAGLGLGFGGLAGMRYGYKGLFEVTTAGGAS
jgi:hypothetical protein